MPGRSLVLGARLDHFTRSCPGRDRLDLAPGAFFDIGAARRNSARLGVARLGRRSLDSWVAPRFQYRRDRGGASSFGRAGRRCRCDRPALVIGCPEVRSDPPCCAVRAAALVIECARNLYCKNTASTPWPHLYSHRLYGPTVSIKFSRSKVLTFLTFSLQSEPLHGCRTSRSRQNSQSGTSSGMDGSPLARGSLSLCSCWLVRPCIRPVGAAFHVPLAIMPFARLRSRSKARTRRCTAPVGSPDPAVSTGFVH